MDFNGAGTPAKCRTGHLWWKEPGIDIFPCLNWPFLPLVFCPEDTVHVQVTKCCQISKEGRILNLMLCDLDVVSIKTSVKCSFESDSYCVLSVRPEQPTCTEG